MCIDACVWLCPCGYMCVYGYVYMLLLSPLPSISSPSSLLSSSYFFCMCMCVYVHMYMYYDHHRHHRHRYHHHYHHHHYSPFVSHVNNCFHRKIRAAANFPHSFFKSISHYPLVLLRWREDWQTVTSGFGFIRRNENITIISLLFFKKWAISTAQGTSAMW